MLTERSGECCFWLVMIKPGLGILPKPQDSAHCLTFSCFAGLCTLVLLHGDNLIRSDYTLKYRVSPGDYQTLASADCIDPGLMEEWGVSNLIEPPASPHLPRITVLHVIYCACMPLLPLFMHSLC